MERLYLCAVLGWLLLHVAAIVSAWATRVASGSRIESAMQACFFALMSGVAAATWIGREINIEIWPASALTLIAMVVAAVIDFRRFGEATHHAPVAAGR